MLKMGDVMQNKKLNVAIVGYGNIGKALEEILTMKDNYNLVAIFSRRDNLKSAFGTSIVNLNQINDYKGKIDIVFLALGSFNDIEKYGQKIARNFNTIDSFDTHRKLKRYICSLDKVGKKFNTVTLCSFGWDPGLMSLIRTVFQAIDGESPCESFWGKGVSQGHSDAIRRVEGVRNAIQYTLPNKEILNKCRSSFYFSPTEKEKHKRECFISLKDGADKEKIEKVVKSMPNYFLGYDTMVNFEDEKSILKRQTKMSHKGFVFKNFTACSHRFRLKFYVSMTSNPHFTAILMIMGAKAVARLVADKKYGAYSILDIPPKYFCSTSSPYDLL